MRVLHVDSAREWRGGQNQVRLLARRLRGRPEIEQVVAGRAGSQLLEAAAGAGVPTLPLPWRPALDLRAVAGLAREAGARDLVHAHTSHALQAAVLALAASGAPARLVAARRVAGRPGSPAVWRRADLVLAVSGAARDGLTAAGVEPSRVRVVHDGVDPTALRPPRPGALRRAAGAPVGESLVGAAGALEPGKGHDLLLRAAARVARSRPGVRFVVAGEGPARRRLERLARELELGDRLALPGHVPDVARSLADLDLFVMCSRKEGLGTAALEAMAAGVPTVVTRAGGLAEAAGDAVPTVAPGDPGALAAEILRLLDDRAARERIGAAGRRRVEERFTARRMADATVAAYREVLDSARKRREHAAWMERAGRLARALAAGPAVGPADEAAGGPEDEAAGEATGEATPP